MDKLKALFNLARDTVAAFFADRATIYAAGISYFSIFAIAPLLILVINIAGVFISRTAAGELIANQFELIFGPELVDYVRQLIEARANKSLNTTATIVSLAFLLVAAAGIFNQLKTAINQIWGVTFGQPQTIREWLTLVRRQSIPFLMVFLFGLMLGLSVLLDTIFGALRTQFEIMAPALAELLPSLNRSLVPLLTFATFLLIYKFLPDATTRWRDIALGALIATLLFLLGRFLLSFYLGASNLASVYGAAGSIIILLIWIYFSAAILLLGAEFIKLYATRLGEPIRPIRKGVLNKPASQQE